MATDLVLAAFHHILMFAVAALLATELVMVFVGLNGRRIMLVSRIDIWFGAAAGMIVVVGFMRVFLGAKPASFYLESPFFWAKIGALAVVALLSIAPTLRFLRWARPARADRSFEPPPAELATVRRFIVLESLVFLLIPIFAAVMARGYGVG